MENMETVQELEENLFTPALVQAFKKARESGYAKEDATYAAANAYMNVLVQVLGSVQEASSLIHSQLNYLTENGDNMSVG